ncbi:septum formation initiator family protein [Patescibacteria group bacterium]|nr:septum formation initiator family protein [Patescibacteria group bacterium]
MAHQDQYKKFIKKMLGSKVFLFLIFIILIILTINLSQESYKKYQLKKEISGLKLEIDRLEGSKQQLSNLMEYFKNDSYLEQEARVKLNLKKPGEKVVILSRDSVTDDNVKVSQSGALATENQDEIKLEDVNLETPNYWKWWEYFFKP